MTLGREVSGLWQTSHLPAAAATGLVVSEATSSPVLGLAAAVASHYVVDGLCLWQRLDNSPNQAKFLNWLGDTKNLKLVAGIDCFLGWGLLTLVGLFSHQSWYFWTAALMGFWPDLDKVPGFSRIFQVPPLSWLARLHEKIHWRVTNAPLIVSCWGGWLVASYIFLFLILP